MKAYTIIKTHRGRTTETTGTLPELVEHFGYTLKAGASYNGQKGCKKVNENPKTIKSLMTSLQNAVYNTQGSRYDQDSYDYTEATTDTTATTTTTENKEETTMTNTTTTKKATTNKKPRAKKSTKTTKKATTPTTVTVVLKAFTGMKIAIYTGTLQDSTITITTKNGKVMEFNTDGTQKVTDNRANNPKFNNKIEVITEA